MRTVAIIQARMGSTRLPGKVMKTLSGKSVLEHVIRRVQACRLLDDVVVATTTSPADDVIVAEAERCGAKWFRGDEEDVLDRYYRAAKQFQADVVVRVTSDCPLFDPETLTEMLECFHDRNAGDRKTDYLSNTLTRTYPRGLDAEIFTFDALDSAHHDADKPYEREHVTPYIYQHPELFSLHGKTSRIDLSRFRWTLDTDQDFMFLQEIYSHLFRDDDIISTSQVVSLLKERPELAEINAVVEQKPLES
jgi:spore coat polysaccharide biosynthesis protein SpsF